jgi:hypothetical protein
VHPRPEGVVVAEQVPAPQHPDKVDKGLVVANDAAAVPAVAVAVVKQRQLLKQALHRGFQMESRI